MAALCVIDMSKEEYSNQTVMSAMHLTSSHSGDLMQQDRVTVRGKGNSESSKVTYDAIFTFNEPLFCSESNVPLNGGYFLTEQGQAEVTQLIGRFHSKSERETWVSQNLKVISATNT